MSDKSTQCNDNEVQKVLSINNFCYKLLIVLFWVLPTVRVKEIQWQEAVPTQSVPLACTWWHKQSANVIYVLFFQIKNDV